MIITDQYYKHEITVDITIKNGRLYRRVCERVWRHTGLQCAMIAYNEARKLVNNLSTLTIKIMFGIVNSLIKPKTESLTNFVFTEECCNKFADFSFNKSKH